MRPFSSGTLLLVPCSGAKRQGDASAERSSILASLEPARASLLATARAALREKAMIDESTLMPAYERYSGRLYEHGAAAVRRMRAQGTHLVIVGGGYGLLLAEEPIGTY